MAARNYSREEALQMILADDSEDEYSDHGEVDTDDPDYIPADENVDDEEEDHIEDMDTYESDGEPSQPDDAVPDPDQPGPAALQPDDAVPDPDQPGPAATPAAPAPDAEDEPAEDPNRGRARERGRGRGQGQARGRARGRGGRGRGRGRGRGASDVSRSRSPVRDPIGDTFVARSGRTWQTSAPGRDFRRGPANIVRERAGPKGEARQADTLRKAFELFVTPDMVDLIVRHSNEEGKRVFDQWNAAHPNKQKAFTETCSDEIMAFIGLLILRGAYRDSGSDYYELWNASNGRPCFRATMSRARFELLMRIMRFDDKRTRDARQFDDRFAPIRELFSMFDRECGRNYTLSEFVTIDETLRRFRGRCSFRVYMPQKPGKYGLLFRVLTDANVRYVHKMLPYAGKPRNENIVTRNSAAENVLDLTADIRGSGRNVTMDRYYTGVDLAKDLYQNHQLTVVGTVQKNRQHVPEELKDVQGREPKTCLFAWDSPVMMVSHIPKPRKNVLLLSTMHSQPDISQRENRAPEVNLFYNSTKGGVDVVDQMIDIYRCKAATNRWPMVVFFTIIDIAALNGFVVFLHNKPQWNERRGRRKRRQFLIDLGFDLIKPWVLQRSTNLHGLRINIRLAMEAVLGIQLAEPEQPAPAAEGTLGKCHVCIKASYGPDYKKKKYNANKVKQICDQCNKRACNKHSRKSLICSECA